MMLEGSITKRFSLYILPSALQGVMGLLILIPVSTYYLEPKDFGLFALTIAIVGFFGILASPATGYVLNKKFKSTKLVELKKIVGSLLVIEFIAKTVFFVVAVLSVFLLTRLGYFDVLNDGRSKFFVIAILSFSLAFCWPILSLVLILDNQPSQHFKIEIFKGVLSITLPICFFVIFKLGELALYLSPLFSQLLSLVIEVVMIRKHCTLNLDRRVFREVLLEWRHSFPASVSELGYDFFNKWMCAIAISLAGLGLYTHSLGYINILKLANKGLTRTFAADLFQCFSSGKRDLSEDQHRVFSIICCFFFVCGGLVIFGSKPLISLITHGKFIDSGNLVVIMYGVVFFFIPISVSHYFFMAIGNARTVSTSTILAKLFTAIILYPLIVNFGLLGAAFAFVLSNCLPLLVIVHYLNRAKFSMRFLAAPLICMSMYYIAIIFYWLKTENPLYSNIF